LLIATRLATGWYIFGSLSAESAEGFSGVLSTKGQAIISGPAVGLEWASFDIGTIGNPEADAAADGVA
jgi:hypothetical protein